MENHDIDVEVSTQVEASRRRQHTVVQVLNSLGLNRGGLTRAVLSRTVCVPEGASLVFAVPSFQTDLVDVFEQMKAKKMIPARTQLESLHSRLAKNGRSGTASLPRVIELVSGSRQLDVTTEVKKTNSLKRYFMGGRFIGSIRRNSDGTLVEAVDHSEQWPWFPISRTVFDKNGAIRRQIFFDSDHNPRYQIYFNPDGGEYLSSWLRPNGTPYRIIQFEASEAKQFDRLEDLQESWFEKVLDEVGAAVVLCDEPSTIFALNGSLPEVRRIATIHASHSKPDSSGSIAPKAWLSQYVDRRNTIDKFVFLTNVQARDFATITGVNPSKLAVIYHPGPQVDPRPLNARERGLLVIVSRLAKDKQVEHAIRAVVRAHKRVPYLRLEIFGTGDQESILRDLIKKSGASEYISMRGQTDNAAAMFARAEASLMTSLHEGFGLVILESMASGTPVISYDTPFGPQELITDGMNGVLSPLNDIEALSKEICRTFNRPGRLRKLQNGARATGSQGSETEWRTHWHELLA